MWSLNRPTKQAEPTFKICISRIRDAVLKKRLDDISPIIEKSERDYITAAEDENLSTIEPLDGSIPFLVEN